MQSFSNADWQTIWQRQPAAFELKEQCTVVYLATHLASDLEHHIVSVLKFIEREVQAAHTTLRYLVVVMGEQQEPALHEVARRHADEVLRVRSPVDHVMLEPDCSAHRAILDECMETGQINGPVVDHITFILDFNRIR